MCSLNSVRGTPVEETGEGTGGRKAEKGAVVGPIQCRVLTKSTTVCFLVDMLTEYQYLYQ